MISPGPPRVCANPRKRESAHIGGTGKSLSLPRCGVVVVLRLKRRRVFPEGSGRHDTLVWLGDGLCGSSQPQLPKIKVFWGRRRGYGGGGNPFCPQKGFPPPPIPLLFFLPLTPQPARTCRPDGRCRLRRGRSRFGFRSAPGEFFRGFPGDGRRRWEYRWTGLRGRGCPCRRW